MQDTRQSLMVNIGCFEFVFQGARQRCTPLQLRASCADSASSSSGGARQVAREAEGIAQGAVAAARMAPRGAGVGEVTAAAVVAEVPLSRSAAAAAAVVCWVPPPAALSPPGPGARLGPHTRCTKSGTARAPESLPCRSRRAQPMPCTRAAARRRRHGLWLRVNVEQGTAEQ
eukprot:354861-Chlamydomonas_euryale.AAC.4